MVNLISSLPSYDTDEGCKMIWSWIESKLRDKEGVCYYKHTVVITIDNIIPDLVVITKEFHPIIIQCITNNVNDIEIKDDNEWIINNKIQDSPLLILDDLNNAFSSKIRKERAIRNRSKVETVLALPLVSRFDFENIILGYDNPSEASFIYTEDDINDIFIPFAEPLSEEEWNILMSVAQGASPLKQSVRANNVPMFTLGEAIKVLDRQIALLDAEQQKVAIQIAPGPQRIRGLAGTGKTVLLAMKAANIHLHFPDQKILFTFNTQSLYNQTRDLITKFYRDKTGYDVNWDNLHIRHAWGGKNKQGVYSDICNTRGVQPLDFNSAKNVNKKDPFVASCRHALSLDIDEFYDFILVDEAQDFPKEFFRMLYKLSKKPHAIYWAYDELQNLTSIRMPKAEELFGRDENGIPILTLSGDPYPGNIEKDFVLHRSYRCPLSVLMLAHAIGLGLYRPEGPIQMLQDSRSWEAIGYTIEKGKLQEGRNVIINRPIENSPNRVNEIYSGKEKLIVNKVFDSREDEIDWIASSIRDDITTEDVSPEKIIVICLNQSRMKQFLPQIQKKLYEFNIKSIIPGIHDSTSTFAEKGYVTLSTVFRAKGNEAYVVYIMSFDYLDNQIDIIESRNRAFTAISRSQAWVRISGVGQNMIKNNREIEQILSDIPKFKFVFPNMEEIYKLDTETSQNKRKMQEAENAIDKLFNMNDVIFANLPDDKKNKIKAILNIINDNEKE